MDEHLQAGTELLGNRLSEGLPEGLEDTLRLFVRAVIDNHRDNPRLHRVLFEEAPRAPSSWTACTNWSGSAWIWLPSCWPDTTGPELTGSLPRSWW